MSRIAILVLLVSIIAISGSALEMATMSRIAILVLLVSIIAISNAEPIRGTKQVVLKGNPKDQPDPVSDCEYCDDQLLLAVLLGLDVQHLLRSQAAVGELV